MRPSKRTTRMTAATASAAATACGNRFAALQEDYKETSNEDSIEVNHSSTAPTKPLSQSTRWIRKCSPASDCHMIYSVDRNLDNDVGAVMTVQGQCERIAMKIDSGAIDTVMPPHVANHFSTVDRSFPQRTRVPGCQRIPHQALWSTNPQRDWRQLPASQLDGTGCGRQDNVGVCIPDAEGRQQSAF